MITKSVIIYDTRIEMSTKYKKIIEQNNIAYTVLAQSFDEVFKNIEKLEPELLIISDSVPETTSEVCSKIRKINTASRPIIIALSKSSYIDDKLSILDAGADDFLSEPIENVEFIARIKAHIRRQKEELSNPITELPLAQNAYKVLRRTINNENDWAMLLIDIDNFKPYKEIYGEIASNKMLQAYTAILKSVSDENDFVGQLDDNSFVIITSSLKAEKLADYLNFAFSSVASKFYNEEDAKRGYIILYGDNKAGCRTPIVSTSIGIISNQYKNYSNYKEAINSVKNIHKMAKTLPGPSKVIDTPQISASGCSVCEDKKILIVETDAAMAYLLSTTLEMQGFQTEALGNYNEVINKITSYNPQILIIDTGNEEIEKSLYTCKKIKKDFPCIKIIVSTVVHNKEDILNTGADLYLPKPYELTSLFNWINRLVEY